VDAGAALARMGELLAPGGTLAVVGLARTRYPADLPFAAAGAIGHRILSPRAPRRASVVPGAEALRTSSAFRNTFRGHPEGVVRLTRAM
jgi:hypothetical protein